MTKQRIEEEITMAGATLGPEIDGYRHCSHPVKMSVGDTYDDISDTEFVIGVRTSEDDCFPFITSDAGRYSYARAIPQKKTRLMTPAEVAEGWAVRDDGIRYRVTAFDSSSHTVRVNGQWCTVEALHRFCKFAKTATSEPVSLEVTE